MRYLNKQRVIGHFVMWALIATGFFLAFSLLPKYDLFSTSGGLILFICAPIAILAIYELVSAFYFRRSFYRKVSFESLIRSGIYGRCVHPTCSFSVFVAWIIFLIYPDIRLLMSVSWMTIIVLFWIRLEKETIIPKLKSHVMDDMNVG
jgi:hypothetical protein